MRERLPALDVLRGIAILGTFASNVWLFAWPGGPQAWLTGGFPAADWLLKGLVNGRFLALLTLLFGIGMELQYRSALRRGVRRPGRFLVRALVLLVEGALHYVLVFEFDVLMGYAITSVLGAAALPVNLLTSWAGHRCRQRASRVSQPPWCSETS